MQILVEGHRYLLSNFEDPKFGQTLQFIQKIPASPESTELTTVFDGTTSEDVIVTLLDRIDYLQGKFPCQENENALIHLQEALNWLNKRTENRKSRGVKGKQLA